MNIGIDDPEPSVRIGQVGRPYAAGRRIAAHVKLFGAKGYGNVFQCTMSLDSCRRMPGNHSNVEFAM